MSVEASDLIALAEKVLKESGIHDAIDIELDYKEKVGKEWRVNFTFRRGGAWGRKGGCFAVNFVNGEITFSAMDRVWKVGGK